MKIWSKDSRLIWADVLSLFVITIFMIIVTAFYTPPEKHYSTDVVDLMSDWQTADGKEYDLGSLPNGDIVLTRDITNIDTNEKRLCMKSSDTFIKVEADGVAIYEYAPEQPEILGKSYGRNIHMIPVPSGTKEITLILHPIFEDTAAFVTNVAVEDAGLYLGDLFKFALPNYSLCLIMAVFGLLMLYMGIVYKSSGTGDELNFFSLGTFAILVGIWSVNDTYIFQILSQTPVLVKVINYLSLIFISYLPVSFTASATNHKDTILLPALLLMNTVNFAATIVLTYLGISDLHDMLNVSQAIIFAAMIMTIYLIVYAVIHKTIEKRFARSLIFGMGAAVVGVAIDLVRYMISSNSLLGASAFTRIGVLLFLMIVGIYLVREHNSLIIEHSRAELMEKMAYTDGLTGLKNRIAFSEKENELRAQRQECVIVQLDINNLKTVNDFYGHAEGDKHIISAAAIISESFAAIGTCYRTGGDEFIAVTNSGDIPKTEAALEEMEHRVGGYNEKEKPPVPLQIAYGFAKYTPPEDQLDTAERLADQRMYERKKQMKAGSHRSQPR